MDRKEFSQNTKHMSEFRGMNDPSASEQDVSGAIPRAKRVPKERVFHGDTFIDQYEWLRDKQSQDVQDYVAAQNCHCEQRMAPLASLRKTLFEEFKSHVQETDMSVPTRMDGYWYFTRTMQGAAIRHAMPRADPRRGRLGSADSGGRRATRRRTGGVRYERRGARPRFLPHRRHGHFQGRPLDAVRHRHDWRRTLRFPLRDLETGDELEERFEGIGGACRPRRTRNGCSMCCWTTRGVHTR